MKPRRCPDPFPPPAEQRVIDQDLHGPPIRDQREITSLAAHSPRSSGFQRAREKNRCARSCGHSRDRPAPVSIPQTVRFPGCARKPQASIVNVRNDGAVNNGANTASSVISDAGTGSTASGSISGNPFRQRHRGPQAAAAGRPSWTACRKHLTSRPATPSPRGSPPTSRPAGPASASPSSATAASTATSPRSCPAAPSPPDPAPALPGSEDHWSIGIYKASTGQYTETELPGSFGPATGTPEQGIDDTFILYAGPPTGT